MARPRRPPLEDPPALRVPRSVFMAELEIQIAEGGHLLDGVFEGQKTLDDALADFHTWDEYNCELIKQRITGESLLNAYRPASGIIAYFAETESRRYQALRDDVTGSIRRLDSLLKRVPLLSAPLEEKAETATEVEPSEATVIFVVHGRDRGMRDRVTRFLQQVTEGRITILEEEASRGKTVIEKFEAVAEASGYAVVLLTADDKGAKRDAESMNLRARQNVVFEFGYFCGAIGRQNVAVLYEDDVELPSDVHGLLYVKLDGEGGWQVKLAKELRSAGIDADLNRL